MEQDAEAGAARPVVGRRDWLVPWSVAASTLGRTPKTLTDWFDKGYVPAVRTPGEPGQLMTYASWLADVMASAARGRAGAITEVTDAWWARHEARREAA
jgi:hypothetical protein